MKETSKKLLLFFCAIFLADLICAMVWAWNGRDTTVFAYSIPATGAAAASAAAFYYNKAKHENLSKGRIQYLEYKMQALRELPENLREDAEEEFRMAEEEFENEVTE